MKNLLVIGTILGILFCASSCTEQQRVINGGGTMTITIPPGKKFVSINWKPNGSLWIIQKNRSPADSTYERFEYVEHSSMGLIEGSVIIRELSGPEK